MTDQIGNDVTDKTSGTSSSEHLSKESCDKSETVIESTDIIPLNSILEQKSGDSEEATEAKVALVPLYNDKGEIVDYIEPPEFGHMDLKVGTVHLLSRHPSKTKTVRYTENIVLGPGDKDHYKVESGVPKLYSLDDLRNLKAVVLCNPKTIISRGLESKIVLLCARKGEKIEHLRAPDDAKAGDLITVEGYKRKPQLPYVNDAVNNFFNDLRVNNKKQVEFKGIPLKVEGKEGFITTRRFKDCAVSNVMNYTGF